MIDFAGTVFRWSARTEDWYFVALPERLSVEIREIPRVPRGFGSVRVGVELGGSAWRTSLFPDAGRVAYVLPLKRSVREAEGLVEGTVVRIRLEVLDA
jgi:hypothetical protein